MHSLQIILVVMWTWYACYISVLHTVPIRCQAAIPRQLRISADNSGYTEHRLSVYWACFAYVLRMLNGYHPQPKFCAAQKSWERKNVPLRIIADVCGCRPTDTSMFHEYCECLANINQFCAQFIRKSSSMPVGPGLNWVCTVNRGPRIAFLFICLCSMK